MARFGPCVSLRDLTGLGDGSGIYDANEMRRNGPDEANGSQRFSFSVPIMNHEPYCLGVSTAHLRPTPEFATGFVGAVIFRRMTAEMLAHT